MRILLVAYYYPPRAIIGARRPAALAKYLRAAGHDVTVLTSALNGAESDGGGELHARDLLTTRLNWRRDRTLGARDAPGDAIFTSGGGIWGSLFVPDVQLIGWTPFAVSTALKTSRRERPDVVITTSPVESAHLVGLALRRLRGVPWVADLRDGWRFEAPRDEWPTAAQRWLDDALERACLSAADAVVTVSEPLSADLRDRLGVAVETIPNGYDPDDSGPSDSARRLVSSRRLTLVHTGGLGHERTLEPVIEALRRMRSSDPSAGDLAELIVAGTPTETERELYAAPDLDGLVRPVGMLPRPDALALQREADVLLLVTSGVRTGEATGKLFEYLAARKPIVVLGEDSEAARIVEATGSGWAIPVRDPAAAEGLLRRIVAGEAPPDGSGADVADYAYPALAARYAALLDRLANDRTRLRSSRSSHSAQ